MRRRVAAAIGLDRNVGPDGQVSVVLRSDEMAPCGVGGAGKAARGYNIAAIGPRPIPATPCTEEEGWPRDVNMEVANQECLISGVGSASR